MPQAVIYNVTTVVMPQIEERWLQWMQDVHIPEVLGTGCFEKHQLVKLMSLEDEENATYAVQYYAANKSDYDRYIELYAVELRKAVKSKWGDNALSFSTLMAVL
jgi:hypothetical protein